MFVRFRLVLLCGLVVLALAAPAAADNDDARDILFLADNGPLVIRLRVRIDGKSFNTAWAEFVRGLFDELDQNHDGTLNAREAGGIPQTDFLRQFAIIAQSTSVRAITSPDQNPGDGLVTFDEFAAYLEHIGFEPLNVEVLSYRNAPSRSGAAASESTGDARLFARLDGDGDGKLSADDFVFSAGLRKLDLDDDETISRGELNDVFNPYANYDEPRENQAGDTPFVILNGRNQSSTQLVKQLLERYDRAAADGNKDRRLSPGELQLPDKMFAKYDADADGYLDFDELRQGILQPDGNVEVVVNLVRSEDRQPTVEIATPADRLPPGIGVRDAGGNPVLTLGKVEFKFIAQNGAPLDYKSYFAQQFEAADSDNNGYVDRKEFDRLGFRTSAFALIDRDGDEMIFPAELEVFAKRVTEFRQSRTVLALVDRGNQLFDALDANVDGRLSAREIALGRGKIALWDDDGDRAVSPAEIPRQWSWSVSRGPTVQTSARESAFVQSNRVPQKAGQRWFMRMDRNGDGELTPREFLGSAADFEHFDRNRDGAIDAAEAAASRD